MNYENAWILSLRKNLKKPTIDFKLFLQKDGDKSFLKSHARLNKRLKWSLKKIYGSERDDKRIKSEKTKRRIEHRRLACPVSLHSNVEGLVSSIVGINRITKQ